MVKVKDMLDLPSNSEKNSFNHPMVKVKVKNGAGNKEHSGFQPPYGES